MKKNILMLLLALCLILCACGNTDPADPADDQTPSNSATNGADPESGSETDPSANETDPAAQDTLPPIFEGVELPPDIFTGDEGVLTSRPVDQVTEPPVEDATEPTVTEPTPTEPDTDEPTVTEYSKGDLLPEDPFFEIYE